MSDAFQAILTGNLELARIVEQAVYEWPEAGEIFYRMRLRSDHLSDRFKYAQERSIGWSIREDRLDELKTNASAFLKDRDADLYGRLTQLGYRGVDASIVAEVMADTGMPLPPDLEFLSMPPSDAELREKERPDFRWPVQGELSSNFYSPPDSVIRRTYIKPVPNSVDNAMGLFRTGYRQMIDRFVSGDLTAWGTLHKGAPDLPVSSSVWLSDETQVDWAGNELLPRPDQRIKIQRIDVRSPENRGEKGAPRKYSWDQAVALVRQDMASGWRPKTGNDLAKKVVEKLQAIGSKVPKDLKQVTTHLKTHELELWENVKQK